MRDMSHLQADCDVCDHADVKPPPKEVPNVRRSINRVLLNLINCDDYWIVAPDWIATHQAKGIPKPCEDPIPSNLLQQIKQFELLHLSRLWFVSTLNDTVNVL